MLFITKRGIERTKNEEKLERIVLNRKVSYNNRAAALDRIQDDTVLARILAALIKRSEELDWDHRDKYVHELTEGIFSRIHSMEAVNILREPILNKYSVIRDESLSAFIRRTNDKPCMLRLYKEQAADTAKYRLNDAFPSKNKDILALTGDDIGRLKQCGCSNLEIAKNTPANLLKYYERELIDEEVIRFYADDKAWIGAMRQCIPEEKVLSALEGSEHRLKALEAYHIPDGVVHLSKCDFGDHAFVLVSVEREPLPDDEMRSESWEHYRCNRCGIKKVKHNDGWGRVHIYEEN